MRRELLALLLCTSCIDRERELAKFCAYYPDAGDCAKYLDGGTAGGGAAGGAAGGTAGGTAGGAAGGAATTCQMSSGVGRLSCSTTTLQTGGLKRFPSLSSYDGGFLAGWLAGTGPFAVELRQVAPGGGITQLRQLTVSVPSGLTVSGAGDAWAMGWLEGSGYPKCTSSASGGVVSIGGSLASDLIVAQAPDGRVAAINYYGQTTPTVELSESASGCPTAFNVTRGIANYVKGISVVSAPQGFVYSVTSSDGGIEAFASDAGSITRPIGLPTGVVSAVSDDGGYLQVVNTTESTTGFHLRSARSDLDGGFTADVTVAVATGWWNVGSCGPDCFALAWVRDRGANDGRVEVSFSSAATSVQKLGGTYDAVCSIPYMSSAVAVAYHGGKLGVLAADTSKIELHICDLPP